MASLALVLGGCASPGDATPTPPTAAPTTVPTRPPPEVTPTPPDESPEPAEGVVVVPQQLNGFAIPGQQVVLLVTATDLPAAVTATATHATATVLMRTLDAPGAVAEVVVVPEAGSEGRTVEATVTATGEDGSVQAGMTFGVVEGEDDRAVLAAELRDRFVPWLAANRPDLGITDATEWDGTMVSPQWLVVSHYLFFSEEWEMHVAWHIMVAPDDWVRIDLRRRFVAATPSESFEISSVAGGGDPHPWEVPTSVWR